MRWRSAARSTSRDHRSTALWLAGIEVTAAFVLAAGALLMVKSLSALTSTDLLFRHDNLLTVRLELPQDRYGTPQSRARFGDAAHDRLSQLPGVEHVVLWGPSMFARSTWISFVAPEEQLPDDNARLMVWRHSTNPGALRNLGIALRAAAISHRQTRSIRHSSRSSARRQPLGCGQDKMLSGVDSAAAPAQQLR